MLRVDWLLMPLPQRNYLVVIKSKFLVSHVNLRIIYDIVSMWKMHLEFNKFLILKLIREPSLFILIQCFLKFSRFSGVASVKKTFLVLIHKELFNSLNLKR